MDQVNHFEIPTKDIKRAREFYKKTFDWEIVPMDEMNYTIVRTGPTDKDQMPEKPGFINGGMTTDDDMVKNAVIVITVKSIDDKLKEIEKSGGKTVMPKTDVGDMGRYARFEDPEGNIVGIWENK